MTSPNGLICFTNCLLPMQDGSLVEKDLWIDERRGIVLNSQVRQKWLARKRDIFLIYLMHWYSYSKRSSPGSSGRKGS